MKEEPYDRIYNSSNHWVLEFISTGKNGEFIKRIEFRPIEVPNYYELVFGDKRKDGSISVYTISNNGDKNKILRTIAEAVRDFLQVYSQAIVFFKGVTPGRTRLYQIAISLHFNDLTKEYEITVLQNGKRLPFRKNIKADAFYVRKRH